MSCSVTQCYIVFFVVVVFFFKQLVARCLQDAVPPIFPCKFEEWIQAGEPDKKGISKPFPMNFFEQKAAEG